MASGDSRSSMSWLPAIRSTPGTICVLLGGALFACFVIICLFVRYHHPGRYDTAASSEFMQSLIESVEANRRTAKIRVAVFDSDQKATTALKAILTDEPRIQWEFVSSDDIREGELVRFDVVVFPGGRAKQQGSLLSETGREEVRQYVGDGGGYVGICAGAFLACANYDWSLDLINAQTLTGEIIVPHVRPTSMAARGAGPVKMELTHAGRQVFGETRWLVDIRFSGGPILSPAAHRELPEYTPLAYFRTEVWEHDAQRGTMIDTPAVVVAPFGKGRVLAFSPHPDLTDGLESFVVRAIMSTAQHPQAR